MPLLLYGTESCPLTKADVQSLDLTVMRFLMKVFRSNNRVFVLSCIGYFNFSLPSHLIEYRQANFAAKLDKLSYSVHKIISLFNISLYL
jgi:hypothetical protein